jgi:hypothetical protein
MAEIKVTRIGHFFLGNTLTAFVIGEAEEFL